MLTTENPINVALDAFFMLYWPKQNVIFKNEAALPDWVERYLLWALFYAMRQLSFSLVIVDFAQIIKNIIVINSIQCHERLLIQLLPNRFFSRFIRFLVIHRGFRDNILAPGQKIIAISVFFLRHSMPWISIISNQIKIIILPTKFKDIITQFGAEPADPDRKGAITSLNFTIDYAV